MLDQNTETEKRALRTLSTSRINRTGVDGRVEDRVFEVVDVRRERQLTLRQCLTQSVDVIAANERIERG